MRLPHTFLGVKSERRASLLLLNVVVIGCQGRLPWDRANESSSNSTNAVVATSFQHERGSNGEEAVAARSSDGHETMTTNAHISGAQAAAAAFGVGSSSSSRMAPITAADTSSSHALKPPPWLQSPLMPYSEWNIKFEELRIGVRVGIGEQAMKQSW